mmetsp:Transcript_13798/g.46632  ORF Transcript_13798/g.46632 Transcript_13798/m.46632 type:complete len:220 (-) Transcript_13798:459-1118(-)
MATTAALGALLWAHLAAASRPVVWEATKVVSQPVSVRTPGALAACFARPDTPGVLLGMNPGIASAEKVEDVDDQTSIWLGRTAPMRFAPGVSVTSCMRFSVTFRPPSMCLEVLGTSVEATGPAAVRKMIEAILPEVESRNTVEVCGDTITSSALLKLQLPLPRWIPLPREQIAKAGPPILQKQLEEDLSALLANYADFVGGALAGEEAPEGAEAEAKAA